MLNVLQTVHVVILRDREIGWLVWWLAALTCSCPALALLMSRTMAFRNTAEIRADLERMPILRPSLNMVASQ